MSSLASLKFIFRRKMGLAGMPVSGNQCDLQHLTCGIHVKKYRRWLCHLMKGCEYIYMYGSFGDVVLLF